MKILVAVKEVGTVADAVQIADGRVVDDCLEFDLNEWDEYALEAAVQYAESTVDDVEVVTVTVGPERCEETIRMALAKGADRAIRVWDEAFTSDRLLDTRARAAVLSAIVEDEAPDLVLTGVQSSDFGFASTGVALADAVEYGWAAVVNDLEIDVEEGVVAVHRELEGGVEELSTVDIPAVLTIQTGINEPRYASLRGIRQAQSKPLDVRDLADLGLSVDDLPGALSVHDVREPESTGDAELWTGSPEETATQLADLLREKGVVEG